MIVLDYNSNQNFQDKVEIETFILTTFVILAVEFVDLIIQCIFIHRYVKIYRHKLFHSQARRDPLEGSIMDFDPD
jgi:hypothetical protein